MTPHDNAKLIITRRWMDKAATDMALVDYLVSEVDRFSGPIAFHSQQAAEKYLKAVLVWRDVAFPKTHDIGKLLKLLSTIETGAADELHEAAFLTPYGAELRYPGDRPDIAAEEALEAVDLARRVRDKVVRLLPGS